MLNALETSIPPLQSTAVSLVPALLPREPRAPRVLNEFPRYPLDHLSQTPLFHVDRIYRFPFVPFGLFSRFLVRLFDVLYPSRSFFSAYASSSLYLAWSGETVC